jgi:hypothetical protein
MATITPPVWQAITGQTPAGPVPAALAAVCPLVDAALKRLLLPYCPEPVAVADYVLDAPPLRELRLPLVPVQGVTAISVNYNTFGNPALFGPGDVLTPDVDYLLLIDDPLTGFARAGVVRRINAVWGGQFFRPPTTLGQRLEPVRGAVLASWQAGEPAVNPDVQLAAALAVSAVLARAAAAGGAPFAAENWNGRGQSVAAAFSAEAALQTPDVARLLRPYLQPKFGC